MIYISYFGNLRNIPKNIIPISIAIGTPEWFNGMKYLKLSPTWEMLKSIKNGGSKSDYINLFNKILSNLDSHKVEKELYEMSGGRDVILLCYEKPEDFCHRHLVAQWFIDNGIEAAEYKRKDSDL